MGIETGQAEVDILTHFRRSIIPQNKLRLSMLSQKL